MASLLQITKACSKILDVRRSRPLPASSSITRFLCQGQTLLSVMRDVYIKCDRLVDDLTRFYSTRWKFAFSSESEALTCVCDGLRYGHHLTRACLSIILGFSIHH